MIIIAHRGNLHGVNPARENSPTYLRQALEQGYYVECDVWLVRGKLWLGHDSPQYETDIHFLQINPKIICHCKTIETLSYLLMHNLHCFFHDKDGATLTSQGKIWLYPGTTICQEGIAVMPEWPSIDYGKDKTWQQHIVDHRYLLYGVCTDHVSDLVAALNRAQPK